MTTKWTFLSNHGRALLSITEDPDVRLRDIAAQLGITERRAHTIVGDLEEGGYIVKERDGRRNHYVLQYHRPLPEDPKRIQAIGAVLDVLTSSNTELKARRSRIGD